MAGSTTRTSPTTDCRRHDAGNTTGGAALASAHPRLHPRLDRARRGGWDEHCVHDDSRKLAMGEAHRPAKTHRLMRALQQRQGEAAPTEGAAAEQQEERAAEQTVTAGTGAGMGPHTVGNGATAGVGCGATISGGAGQEAESDDGATDDIRRRADGQRSGGAVGGVVGGNGAAGTGDAGEKEEEAPQADRQTQLPTHPTQTTASYGSGSSSSRTRRGNATAEPGDCTETPLVGAQSRRNGTPRASSRPADRFPAFPTTTHPAFPTWPWQLDI